MNEPDHEVEKSSSARVQHPYCRAFLLVTIWCVAIGLKMVSRHTDHWSTYPFRNLAMLIVPWIVTALLLGLAATKFQRLSSWPMMAAGTVLGSLLILGIMAWTTGLYGVSPEVPKFETTDEMMKWFASETTRWVKKDRGIDLDYSLESIQTIEEELARISKNVDGQKPPAGTFGLALAYGAYIGEVFRRRAGGFWAEDDPAGGQKSFPLVIRSNATIFPVGWCWKRLTLGEEDNVYHKAQLLTQPNAFTNAATGDVFNVGITSTNDAKAPAR
jgi:hypothetical protein